MKKRVRRLELNRETIHALDRGDMQMAVGGATDAASCGSYPNTCPPCTEGTTTRPREEELTA